MVCFLRDALLRGHHGDLRGAAPRPLSRLPSSRMHSHRSTVGIASCATDVTDSSFRQSPLHRRGVPAEPQPGRAGGHRRMPIAGSTPRASAWVSENEIIGRGQTNRGLRKHVHQTKLATLGLKEHPVRQSVDPTPLHRYRRVPRVSPAAGREGRRRRGRSRNGTASGTSGAAGWGPASRAAGPGR